MKAAEVMFSKGLLSVDADNAELRVLLEEIARKTGTSVSIGPGLERKRLSVHFSNLDLESALNTILRSGQIVNHVWAYRPSQQPLKLA